MSTWFIAATALSWCFLGMICWLGWQLLRQNGRILLRLDEVEKRLDELEFDESSSSRREEALTGNSAFRQPPSAIRNRSEPRHLGWYESVWQSLPGAQQDQTRRLEGRHTSA